jgi:hypothetical protein
MPHVRVRDVLAAIFDGCDGLLELRAKAASGIVQTAFVATTDAAAIATFVAAHPNDDVWYGVASRKDATSGKLANCQHLGALFVDLDCDGDADRLAAAEARLGAFALPPSIVIRSGGGLQCDWLMREPIDVQSEQQTIYAYLRRLAAALEGDRSAAEPARVLRLPGTRNHKAKYGTPRPVTIQTFEPSRRYNLSEFDEILPADVAATMAASPAVDLSQPILEGMGRNDAVYKHGRGVKLKGAKDAEVAASMHALNQTFCKPPIGAEEMQQIVRNVLTQPDRVEGVADVELEHDAVPAIPVRHWPAPVGDAAYCGVFGACVQTLAPHTEADPIALLVHVLVSFGNAIGRSAHWRAEADVHYLNLFAALVGETAKGRKGVSGNQSRHLLRAIDLDWVERCNKSGLSSGEGLIWAVRDPIEKQQPIKDHGRVTEYQTVVEDPGIADKRLLVTEAEFASTLRVLERDGNTLSALLRQAWDGHDLRVLTKNSPATSTAPHISLLVHITRDELRRYLGRTEAGNGFGNRFLWACVRRSKVLPDGGGAVDWDPLVGELRASIAHARKAGELHRDRGAADLWRHVYGPLSDGRPGLLGAMTARAEAQVMRLASLYALGERSYVVTRAHLEAALALWRYCFDSARYIFGDCLGDSTADAILQALRGAAETGLTRAEILHHVFGRNKPAADIVRALGVLEEAQLARHSPDPSGGGVKPADRWFATSRGDDLYDLNDLPLRTTPPSVVNVVNVVTPAADEPLPAWVIADEAPLAPGASDAAFADHETEDADGDRL